MELEHFVAQLEHPILELETINDVIYEKSEEDWDLFSGNNPNNASYLFAMLHLNRYIIRHIKYLCRKYNRIVDEEYQKRAETKSQAI